MAQDGPEQPKMAPGRPQNVQDNPRRPQDDPKTGQDDPKTAAMVWSRNHASHQLVCGNLTCFRSIDKPVYPSTSCLHRSEWFRSSDKLLCVAQVFLGLYKAMCKPHMLKTRSQQWTVSRRTSFEHQKGFLSTSDRFLCRANSYVRGAECLRSNDTLLRLAAGFLGVCCVMSKPRMLKKLFHGNVMPLRAL